jgi:hypothetical protein
VIIVVEPISAMRVCKLSILRGEEVIMVMEPSIPHLMAWRMHLAWIITVEFLFVEWRFFTHQDLFLKIC